MGTMPCYNTLAELQYNSLPDAPDLTTQTKQVMVFDKLMREQYLCIETITDSYELCTQLLQLLTRYDPAANLSEEDQRQNHHLVTTFVNRFFKEMQERITDEEAENFDNVAPF